MDLKGKQKHFLRSQAHSLRPMFSVGKNGLTQSWLDQLAGALETRELIKVNLLQNADVNMAETKTFIETDQRIAVVQTIGHTLVLFMPAKNPEHQRLSKQVAALV
ncbi:MAG TPA: ribosome assembly RNA-binding protein YhbY [Lactobacillus sp.]|nr:ribosome assembly RNA-binding protein YhbY [Lactobacillus sp.]